MKESQKLPICLDYYGLSEFNQPLVNPVDSVQRPISQRFCATSHTVKFYCVRRRTKSLRNGPLARVAMQATALAGERAAAAFSWTALARAVVVPNMEKGTAAEEGFIGYSDSYGYQGVIIHT